jgi:hypothetical protein
MLFATEETIMSVADIEFDESNVVNVKNVPSDFESSMMSTILVHFLSENYDAVYVNGADPVRFPSKEEMIKAYWNNRLD